MDARRLGMLAALDRLGTVAAVAEQLHLTPPGVSMQLSALEREAGVTLTERRGRRLALTPAGRLLAAHGDRMLDQLALAEMELDALRRGSAGRYRVAAFPTAARTFVARAWHGIRAEGSGIDLSLTTPEPEEALAALETGDADLAIVHGYSNVPRGTSAEVVVTALAVEPVRLAIRADDPVAAPTIALADLARHDWITATPELTCFEMTDRACGLAGFRPVIAAQSMDFSVQLRLVAAGAGVALIPALAIDELPDGVLLAETDITVERRILATTRRSLDGDPGIRRLIDVFRAEADRALVERR